MPNGEETPSEGLTGALFDRVKVFFTNMWAAVWEIDPVIFVPFWGNVGTALTESVEDKIAEKMGAALGKQAERLNMPQSIKDVLATLTQDKDFDSVLLGYIVMGAYYINYISGHAATAAELSSHVWRDQYRPTLPNIEQLIITLFRDPTKSAQVRDSLHKHGYSDENIDVMFAASKSVLAPDEIKNLFLRGEIDESSMIAGYKSYGFSDSEIERIRKLFYPIPGYQDLIRMAVREAFYPDYVEEYGLLEELPGDFITWAGKQGLSEEWCKHYWASHWELPSILRGYEMLHRGVIEDTDLDKLFMAVDIMPWWRDKLKAISYHPLTRVDVRRVYRMGIIDREQVFRTYLDLGYNEEKAEWLTAFTEMQNTEQDRDLSKAEILSAYVKSIINRSICTQMLIELGYSEDETEILITTKEYQEYKENKARELKTIQKNYLAGVYTANQAIAALGNLDMTGAEQDSIMKLWDSEKLAKLRAPSKKDLDSLFSAGIITILQYQEELQHLGYSAKYRQWFSLLIEQKGMEEE